MISEDRIRSMTKLAVFEEGEGKKPIKLANYSRSDYRALQMIKYFILGTIAFAIMVFAYGYYLFTEDRIEADLDYITGMMTSILTVYIIFMVIYMFICVLVSMRRFRAAKRMVKGYKKQLKTLSKEYEWEMKVKKEGTLTHMSLWDDDTLEDS